MSSRHGLDAPVMYGGGRHDGKTTSALVHEELNRSCSIMLGYAKIIRSKTGSMK